MVTSDDSGDDDEDSNSTVKSKSSNAKKFKRNRSKEEISNEDFGNIKFQLKEERKKNNNLVAQLEEMQNEIKSLTKSVQDLNKILSQNQNEKTNLYEIIDKLKNGEATQLPISANTQTNRASIVNETTSNNNAGNCKNSTSDETKFKKSNKIPPIDVWNDEPAAIQSRIIEAMPKNSCIFSKLNKSKFRIFAISIEIKNKLIEFLKERGYHFNTYMQNNEKPINILIKNSEIDDANVILKEFENIGIKPINVKQFKTGYMKKNDIHTKIWHVTFHPNTDLQEIFKIKYIGHHTVKIEHLKKPKITQCKRCQRFNHSASSCFLPYRCVKCTNTHEPGQCQLNTSKTKLKPKCVNCLGEHTANDASKCSAYQRAMEIRESKNKKEERDVDRNKKTYAHALKASEKDNKITAHHKQNEIARTGKQNNNNNNKYNAENFFAEQNKMMKKFFTQIQQMQCKFFQQQT